MAESKGNFFVHRPIVAMVIAIVIVIVGVVSMIGLPIEQYPNLIGELFGHELDFCQINFQSCIAVHVADLLEIADALEAAHHDLVAVWVDADLVVVVWANGQVDEIFVERVGDLVRFAASRWA